MPTPSTFPRRYAITQRFSLGAPRGLRVANDDSRIVFARSTASDDPVNRLWVLDLETGRETMVADPVLLLAGSDTELTEAEKARRERAREAGGGITRFVADAALTSAVYVLSGRVFRTNLVAGTTQELDTAPGAFDPRLSPCGDYIAYVANGALRVHGPKGDRLAIAPTAADQTWGQAEFVAAEEMGRSRGFWWGPTADHILAARVDTSAVDEWTIAAPVEPWKPARTVRYPAAGTTNATVDLAIIDRSGTPTFIDWQTAGGGPADGEQWEYLANASWGSREHPTLTVQSRDQRTVAVLTVDPSTAVATEKYRWTDDTWIELISGTPTWYKDRLITVEDRGSARRLVVDGTAITADDLQVMSVLKPGVDCVVSATTDSSETHIYRVNLITGTAEQLTGEPGVHSMAMGNEVTVTMSSTLDHFGSKARINDGRDIVSLAETPDVSPQPRIMRAGQHEVRTALLLPTGHQPGASSEPLPVLLDPYGGPHARRVLRARNAFLTSQWFADQGFAVIVTDGRGTPARGPAFEREVYGDLAAPVLEDQITALHAVAHDAAANGTQLDLSRVGIRGWSFGGYLAALAVIRRPDVFHAAIAGAPVTDWRLYDTHYTERYMGHPDEVPEHYDACNLCLEAAQLSRPLMLIHGLADDNVVAAHTLALSRALLEAGRPHEVLPLSGVTHMTPQAEVAENLLRLQLTFLRDNLR